jgi:hypothetical protein
LQLATFSLNNAPLYEALSYVWGNRTPEYTITVNDLLFEVGSSLHIALAQLAQATTAGTWLWIDAICIDQTNVDEKSSQVQQMRDIFQAAHSVWVSLGESSQDVDSLLSLMDCIGPIALKAGVLELWDTLDDVISQQGAEKHPAVLFLPEMLKYDSLRTEGAFRATVDLLGRSNWSRAWILQEIALATRGNILCGSKTIEIDEFHAVLTAIYFAKIAYFPRQNPEWRDFGCGLSNNYFHIHSLLARQRRSRGGDVSLLDLLLSDHRGAVQERPFHEASDPRDIIYALMGGASDADCLEIVPDYQRSVSEVYVQATKAIMAHYPQYKLEYCSFPKDNAELPSWVPDWQRIGRLGVSRYLGYGSHFKASGGRTQTVTAPLNTLNLSLRGIFADSIVDILTIGVNDNRENPLPEGMKLANGLKFKSSRNLCIKSILRFAKSFVETRASEPDLWRLMLAGEMDCIRRAAEFDALAPKAFRGETIRADMVSENQLVYMLNHSYPFPRRLTADEDLQKFVDNFCERIVVMGAAVGRGRTLFLTHRGSLGLGPYHVKVGDSVTIIFGTQIPIILRPAAGTYTYVGEAYVHGMMQGEFMSGTFEETEFEII